MSDFKTYFAIESKLKKQGFNFDRSELIGTFTADKKKGLSELTDHEYREFINWLNKRFPASKLNVPPEEEKMQLQRRKIIALFRKMGYQKDNKADMVRIYGWVLKYGYLNKSLKLYNSEELPMLVTQAENVYKSFLKGM